MGTRTTSTGKKPTPEGILEAALVSAEEGHALFDAEARKLLGISGDEFIRKWDAHELDVDGPQHGAIIQLSFLMDFAR